jgi:hypothetical protein
MCSTEPTMFQKCLWIFSLFFCASLSEILAIEGYLAQYGNSSLALWYLTHSLQLAWRGQSFFGQGQFGAKSDMTKTYRAMGI